MPSQKQYEAALRRLEDGLHPNWRNLLRAHWASPRHTTSMALLARAIGYPASSAANLNYGRLAGKIGMLVGLPPDPDKINLRAVATWGLGETNEAGHFTFTMRRQLAKALENLGWTTGAQPPLDDGDPARFLEGKRSVRFAQHIARERRAEQSKDPRYAFSTGSPAL